MTGINCEMNEMEWFTPPVAGRRGRGLLVLLVVVGEEEAEHGVGGHALREGVALVQLCVWGQGGKGCETYIYTCVVRKLRK